MERKVYQVITGREPKWWWIEIPDVDMGFSQARHLRQVEPMAREVISLLLDVPEDSFDVNVTIKGDEADLINEVNLLDAEAAHAQKAAQFKKAQAVKALRKKDIPVRDIAVMLHVSPAWVSELSRSDNVA